uniref:SH2 domain-containing protein n=1 Tax=Steinernema glaseri TaxID=37863 RepID=A0A1I7YVT0_9BILA
MGSCLLAFEFIDFTIWAVEISFEFLILSSSTMNSTRCATNLHLHNHTASHTCSRQQQHSPPASTDDSAKTQKPNNVVVTMERCVPVEYSSSPIVEILADSANQKHPRPPNMPRFGVRNVEDSLSSSSSEKEKKRRSGLVKAKAAVVFSQSSAVTLLDQIVLTHPIWYLQNIGRAQATHLLRPMHQGAFIVRASSRSNSMALSIRLPEGYGIDTDHYLIEHCTGSTRAVRLESSPNSFKSLPHLIEHYCRHGEELQTKLVLPEAIAACTTTPALQSIALMGQDFWTSEVSQHHAHPGQKPVPMQRSRVAQPERRPISLKKSLSSQDGFSRSGSGTVSSTSSSSTSSSSKKGASFLKSLFSGSGNDLDKEKPVRERRVSTKSSITTHGLAHCEYFTPCLQNGITSSQSAFTVGGNHRDSSSSFSKVPSSSSLYSGSIRSSSSRNSLKTFKPVTTAESHDNVNAMNLHGSGTGSWKKSFPFGKGIALRRERSDLCASSVDRLAYHHHGSTSPGPQLRRKDRAGSASSGNSSPLVPPVGKPFMDRSAINSCIEELRKKRFTSTERSSPDSVSGKTSTSSDSSSHVASLRRKHEPSMNGFSRLQDQEHRLSVPNLAEAMECSDVHQRNAASAGRALRAKLGRVPGTGELQTINEGLITPVVRRKQFSVDISAKPVITSAPSPSPSTGSSSTSSSQQSPPAKVAAAGWSAVASEIKTRQQKIAKVRPTPSRMVLPPVKSVSGSRLVPHQSEYAQLSEFSDVSLGKGVASVIDDDNVSVAGTVFNEPWDSNVWENLLDLAQYGDEKPTSSPSANLRSTLSATTADTIHEEDGTELEDEDDDVEVMCASVGSDTETEEETTKMEECSSSPNENRDVYSSLYRSRKSVNGHETNSQRRGTILRIGSKCWNEMSQRIPSEPASKNSTYDRKSRSSGCDDVSLNSLGRRRTLTPNNSDWILTESTITLIDNQPHEKGDKGKAPTLSPILSPPRLRSTVDNSDPGIRIQSYVEKLAQDSSTVFGATLQRFIECTLESVECDPHVVIRNVRQFLNGIKNYLVKHGEADLHSLIESESANLNSNEFLNIDAILEAVLHKILLVPVKAHLYHLMVREYSKNGSLQSLSENLQFVRTRTSEQLGFSSSIRLPSNHQMDTIKMCLRKMQHHYSPLKKLDNLLKALSVAMEDSLKLHDTDGLPSADELVRWLVYILAKTSTVGCEVEAWYMWELLPQQLLTSGDVSYYLTTLFSAIHVLKNVDCIKRLANPADDRFIISATDDEQSSLVMGGSDGLVKVAVPNESEGSIKYHTFPAVPQMTAAKLCRVIAHRFAVTNPEDYGLYILFDGFETCLLGTEFPDTIREQLRKAKKPHLFAYKRHEAKIAWPKFPQPSTPVKI